MSEFLQLWKSQFQPQKPSKVIILYSIPPFFLKIPFVFLIRPIDFHEWFSNELSGYMCLRLQISNN